MYTAKGDNILFACEDKEFAEKYTRSSFKFKYGGYYNSPSAKWYWDNYQKGIIYPVRTCPGKDLTEEDSVKAIHCMNCDKILINNASRYCNCEYKINEKT